MLGELHLELRDAEKPRDPIGQELDEQVDVTVRPQLTSQRGAEEAEAADAVRFAECFQHTLLDGDPRGELHDPSLAGRPLRSHDASTSRLDVVRPYLRLSRSYSVAS